MRMMVHPIFSQAAISYKYVYRYPCAEEDEAQLLVLLPNSHSTDFIARHNQLQKTVCAKILDLFLSDTLFIYIDSVSFNGLQHYNFAASALTRHYLNIKVA